MSNKKKLRPASAPQPSQDGFRPDSVVVAILHPAEVAAPFAKSLRDLMIRDAYAPVHAVIGDIDMSSGANINAARNKIVREFLTTTASWLWMIDADMVFEPDTLDRLLADADPVERPIIGGLCFRVTQDRGAMPELIPTLYGLNNDSPPRTVVYHDYPPDALVQVAATGAACLLVHRSVFEGIAAAAVEKKFQAPYTWFAETLYPEYKDVLSEDITFCLRAGACGFPVHVDTSIEIGHQKSFIATAAMFQALKPKVVEGPPTFAVIAGRDRHDMTRDLLEDLAGQGATVLLYDNGSQPAYDFPGVEIIDAAGWGLHEMWADGIKQARSRAPECNIAILNNDLRVGPDFLRQLGLALRGRDDVWISYPDMTGQVPFGRVVPTSGDGQTLTGYAFMFRGETDLDIDTRYAWWYGDFDLEMQCRAAGKYVVTVGGCQVEHLEPTKSTRGERLEQAKADEVKFAEKWNLDPAKLFLARHPEFGR